MQKHSRSDTLLFLIGIILLNFICAQDVSIIKGCTNPLAKNYNREATQDDGSCVLYYSSIKGCTNSLAKNYNRNATENDGSCIFNDEVIQNKEPKPRLVPIEIIYGCIDSAACNYNEKANEDDNTCQYLDNCGVCDGNNSTCVDCLGVVNGQAVEDKCGVCDIDLSNDCIQDCSGMWGGDAVIDECGICDGDNSTCMDCLGIINGEAVEDKCGVCDTDLSNDCIQDCSGTWGGDTVIDECGVCNGDNLTCMDCLGVVNGEATKDKCGICDIDSSNDCIRDCSGTWGGDAIFDICGVCNGDNSQCTGCMDEKASNYDSNAKIDDRSTCTYNLVYEESNISGYTDREFTRIDLTAYFMNKDNTDIGVINSPNFGFSFGYEGDIYKRNNFMLSYGIEFMLGQKFQYTARKRYQNFSLHSIYLSPIFNLPQNNIAIYSKLGFNILNLPDEDMLLDYFQSGDYGVNIGVGIVFVVNDIRFLIDYNFHNLFLRQYDFLDSSAGFHRFGITVYHNLISKLRDKK